MSDQWSAQLMRSSWDKAVMIRLGAGGKRQGPGKYSTSCVVRVEFQLPSRQSLKRWGKSCMSFSWQKFWQEFHPRISAPLLQRIQPKVFHSSCHTLSTPQFGNKMYNLSLYYFNLDNMFCQERVLDFASVLQNWPTQCNIATFRILLGAEYST